MSAPAFQRLSQHLVFGPAPKRLTASWICFHCRHRTDNQHCQDLLGGKRLFASVSNKPVEVLQAKAGEDGFPIPIKRRKGTLKIKKMRERTELLVKHSVTSNEPVETAIGTESKGEKFTPVSTVADKNSLRMRRYRSMRTPITSTIGSTKRKLIRTSYAKRSPEAMKLVVDACLDRTVLALTHGYFLYNKTKLQLERYKRETEDNESNLRESEAESDRIEPKSRKAKASEQPPPVFDEKTLFKSHEYNLLFRAKDLKERAIQVTQSKPPRLRFGLDRVLFNPGVYHLRNQRTGVFNFDPFLEHIDPVDTFDIEAMSSYTIPSEDKTLTNAARKAGCKYTTSTSSSTDLLKHLHFLISNVRTLNDGMLSKGFESSDKLFFTRTQKKPSSVFLRYKEGTEKEGGLYSVDTDGHLDPARELSMTGVLLEKLLTAPRKELETFKLQNGTSAAAINADREKATPGSYHYTAYGNILVRSQLDAYDPRLPGAGIFDLKTRACAAVRLDWEERQRTSTSNYQLRDNLGLWESYEREQYDLMRTAMLKYSLQVRLGRMDGIFLAYHNTAKIFGFQYMPLEDMDYAIHGQKDRSLGDQELLMSMALLEELFERATKKFPNQTLWIHFDTRFWKAGPLLRIFIEPIPDELCVRLKKQEREQEKKKALEESTLAQVDTTQQPMTQEELAETSIEADQLAKSAAALAKIMEENRPANQAELAEFGYTEDQIVELLVKYLQTIATMEKFATSPAETGEDESALELETNMVASIKAALTECLPLLELFPQQRDKAHTLFRESVLANAAWQSPSAPEPTDEDEVEERYFATHEPTQLMAYELRVVNHVAGFGFVERPTNVQGTGAQRRLAVRASIKEVSDGVSKKRTYEIMRKAKLASVDAANIFYESFYFNNLLRLSEAGKRWSERQERADRNKKQVRYESFDRSERGEM